MYFRRLAEATKKLYAEMVSEHKVEATVTFTV